MHAGNDDSGALWLTSSLRFPQVFAAAQLETLQQRLSRQEPSQAPFLLQALVTAPNLVDGDPTPRLLTLATLLVQGARLNGSAKAAAVAANVLQDAMLVSVCRGFHTEEGAATPTQPTTPSVANSHSTCVSVDVCVTIPRRRMPPRHMDSVLPIIECCYTLRATSGDAPFAVALPVEASWEQPLHPQCLCVCMSASSMAVSAS